MEKSLFEQFSEINEYYAAGLFEKPERSPQWRYSNALKPLRKMYLCGSGHQCGGTSQFFLYLFSL